MSNFGNFIDPSGVTRLRATGGGGGFMPARNIGQASFDFSEDVVNADGLKRLTLSFDSGDASLVDLTTPTYPNVITAGVYAFMAAVNKSSGSDSWLAGLLVDDNYYSLTPKVSQGASVSSGDVFGLTAPAVVWWCDAADPFAVLGQLSGSPDTVHLQGVLYVQRIT